MITTKQRAKLKSMAMTMNDLAQIGKDGITESVLESVKQVLDARELVKIKVQKNCDYTAKEIATKLQNELNCEIVLVVGSKVIIYKESERKDINHIEIDWCLFNVSSLI